jgi:hypothetical protein
MNKPQHIARRAFLQRVGQLGVAGVAAPWALNLAAMGEAAAFTADDYRAWSASSCTAATTTATR